MKKFSIIILLLLILLCGCAAKQQSTYVIPQEIKDRPVVSIYKQTLNCLNLREDGAVSTLRIHPSKEANAWVDDKNDVFLAEGLFRYDDDVLTFVIAHELSHAKLKHVRNQRIVSYTTTGVLMVTGLFIPGAGLLNHAVNPAVTNNFSKSQEYDADRLAAETLVTCFNIPVEKQIHILESLQADSPDGGGFWARHPSWNDRIKNIKSASLKDLPVTSKEPFTPSSDKSVKPDDVSR